MNRSKEFIVFSPKDDGFSSIICPFIKKGHTPSSGIYALHPSNETNQVFFSLFAYHLQTIQNLQDYTTGSMEIHSNPVAITNNK